MCQNRSQTELLFFAQATKNPKRTESQQHWRRQLWSTGARAPPRLPTAYFFWSLQSSTKLWNWSLCGCMIPRKSIQAYSFVTVYCVNFVIFFCVTLKLFSVSLVPLLAPNPGDAIAQQWGFFPISYHIIHRRVLKWQNRLKVGTDQLKLSNL